MSIYVTQTSRNFTLKQENIAPAYDALRQYLKNKAAERESAPARIDNFYSLVLTNTTFFDTMEALSFELVPYQTNGNGCSNIEFLDEEWDDCHKEVLETIAPYVEEGSFLEFCDEEGELFRVVFHNGTTQIIRPQIVWPMPQTL